MTVFVNGRFLGQPVTGVQRYAIEMASAIDSLECEEEWRRAEILVPQRAGGKRRFGRLRTREVGRWHGHLWEQADLPSAANDGVLVSLGNTGPVLAGSRQVVVIHDAGVFDTPGSYSRRFRGWYRTLQHALVRRGARIATVSEFSRGRIADRLGIEPGRIAVTLEGADHILRVDADPGTLARHRLEAGRFALVVGSRVAHKSLDSLRQTATELARRGLVLASAGSAEPSVFRAIEESGAGRRLGRVSDAELRALYGGAACLLFPSRYEGFGLPPLEAMACGCPVIAARSGAVEEICGDAALYVEPGDGAGMRRAAGRLLDEPGLAEGLRAAGLARAERFRWTESARRLGAVVRDLGGGGP